uniref:Uncharacterized protein n=1 Tax=Picea glauca TaxID=3330 RepID=A0A101M288_PICGL|nr:hypothetical protein ABT39_MTgene2859 [Picea glauca]
MGHRTLFLCQPQSLRKRMEGRIKTIFGLHSLVMKRVEWILIMHKYQKKNRDKLGASCSFLMSWVIRGNCVLRRQQRK